MIIPLRDDVPKSAKTFACYGLIGLMVIHFIWELRLESTGELSRLVQRMSIKPSFIYEILQDVFRSGNPAALFLLILSLLSVFTVVLIHGSFGQILGNLLFLWVFGRSVESEVGTKNFLLIFWGCGGLTGLLQIILQMIFDPDLTVPIVGANSAIACIFGAYLVRHFRAKVEAILPLLVVFIPITLPAWFFLIGWFGQQFFYGFGSLEIVGGVNYWSVGYWAHGVGIIVGMLASQRIRYP